MRMRRKKHLDERINECKHLLIEINYNNMNLNIAVNETQIFDVKDIFRNSNPVEIEIGCGKGQFVAEIAKLHPEINFIAVERTKNVIVEAMEKIKSIGLTNVRFINCPAEYLENYFPQHSIEKIYLNFSPPFPKNRYAKHRLTHENYLKIYKKILKPCAEIHMKTDNVKLFEFTINSMSGFGFTLKNVTFDLHSSDFSGNIVTEYEKRFTDMGYPIYRLESFINNE